MTKGVMMQAGEADAMLGDWSKVFADLAATGQFNIVTKPTGMMALIPDCGNPDSPYYDKRVREAIEYAIDREALMEAKGWGVFNAANQIANNTTPVYDPNHVGREFNPDKARQLLEDAGHPNGFDTRILVAPVGATDRDLAVAIQNYLGKVGINVELEFMDYAKYVEYRYGTWNNAMMYQPTGQSAANFNSYFTGYMMERSGVWQSVIEPEPFEQLCAESLATPMPDNAKIRAILDLLEENAIVIPLNDTHSGAIYSKNLHDVGFLEHSTFFWYMTDSAWLSK
jgi:peptide/nickel transport system substrate-binding protein